MKKNTILLPILVVFALFLLSCEGSLDNTFAFRNLSQSKLLINFRAKIVEVPVGETVTVKDVPRGTFAFSTTINELPQGASSSAIEGDAAGSVIFKTGTRVLVLYTSTLSEDSSYTLIAALTTSDDLTTDEGPTEP